jgi:oxygen-dependent protoporphyrinogen oxidase
MPVTLIEQAAAARRPDRDGRAGRHHRRSGPEAFSLSAPALAGLLDELGLRAEVEPAREGSVAVALATPVAHAWSRCHRIAGIPANVWAEPVRALVGGRSVAGLPRSVAASADHRS